MRIKYLTALALIGLIFVSSCKTDKEHSSTDVADYEQSVVFTFTSDDSLAIDALADQYISLYNSGDFNSAAQMLYTVHNDSILPLSEKERTSFISAMSKLPQFGFQKKELVLKNDLDNRVRIAMLMDPSGSLEDEVGTVNVFLNPVKIRGEWFLTLFDKYAEGVE